MTAVDPLHVRLCEAVLFASAEPVSEKQLMQRLPREADLQAVINELAAHYRDRGVALMRVGAGWAFRTAPDLGPHLTAERRVTRRLSRAAIETLAIIAYHQPVSRAEIEEIRGVQNGSGTLDVLIEAGWIRPLGRRPVPGRPVIWGTTDAFLDHFGLTSLDALPGLEELKASGLVEVAVRAESLNRSGVTTGD